MGIISCAKIEQLRVDLRKPTINCIVLYLFYILSYHIISMKISYGFIAPNMISSISLDVIASFQRLFDRF